jgi:hypothetical protein
MSFGTAQAAQREIDECDAKLRQHRAALQAGGRSDPADKPEVYSRLGWLTGLAVVPGELP